MTESEILTFRNEVTTLVVAVFSLGFSMVSAYIAGLWLFLKGAGLPLRLVAFALLSAGLAFAGVMAVGLNELLLGSERSWSKLASNSVGIAGFGSERPAYLFGLSMYELGAGIGGLVFAAIYVALFILTFLYRWPQGPSR
jgi:hypothetical protein